MSIVGSKAINRKVVIEREIGRFGSNDSGPTIVIFAGIHGNEPSGVFALKDILQNLTKINAPFKGQLIALAGNKAALNNGERFIEHDLNRIWHSDTIKKIRNSGINPIDAINEINEQIEIYKYIRTIFESNQPPYYFVDLHTTSSESIPFITLNDTLRNRNFAMQFPVPIILGIEEFIPGTLMSYVNELGPIGFGFEGGKHDSDESIKNHIACLWLTMAGAGCLKKKQVPGYQGYYDRLRQQSMDNKRVFEIRHRHNRTEWENFKMLPGYKNFQFVKKGQHLAGNNSGELYSTESGRIFLPLYQDQGDDGYFIIREIKMFWLKISAMLRTLNAEQFLRIIPGIKQDKSDPHTFHINTRFSLKYIRPIFHLLGFRKSATQNSVHHFTRRKFDVTEPDIYRDQVIDRYL